MSFGRLGLRGLGLGRLGGGSGGASGPRINLSSATIADTASIGDVVGTLSVTGGSGSYTYTLTDDAGGLFAIDVAAVEVAGALTAGSYSITVQADNGVDAPISRAFLITVTHEAVVAPLAPLITWNGDTEDTTPDFDIDLPLGNDPSEDVEVGDDLVIEYQLASGGSFTEYLRHTIIQDDIDGNPITESGLTPLASDDYKFRARLERGATIGDWSTLEDVTVSAVSVPANSVAPAISGNTQVGQTLTTTDGTWSNSPTGYAYQWKRDGSDISGATASTYLLAEADAGADITCAVTASNAGGAGSPATSNSLAIDVYAVFLAPIEDASDQSTYSGGVWSNISLGVAASNRKIVIGPSSRYNSGTSNSFSGATLDGNAMTTVVNGVVSGQNISALAIIDKPTGATGNFSVAFGPTQQRCGAGVWALYGAGSSTPSDTKTATTGVGAVASATLVVPAKGAGIAAAFGSGSVTATWAGLVEDYDAAIEAGIQHSGAHLNSNAGGSIAMSCTWSSTPSTNGILAAAAWGP
jgi:hypothetical protein